MLIHLFLQESQPWTQKREKYFSSPTSIYPQGIGIIPWNLISSPYFDSGLPTLMWSYFILMSSLIEDSWIFIETSALTLWHYHMSGSLWKTEEVTLNRWFSDQIWFEVFTCALFWLNLLKLKLKSHIWLHGDFFTYLSQISFIASGTFFQIRRMLCTCQNLCMIVSESQVRREKTN